MVRLQILISILLTGFFSAQDLHSVHVEVIPLYKGKPVIISEEKPFSPEGAAGFEISQLKFYLSHFELYNDHHLVFSEENSYHLIDASDERSMKLMLLVPESLKFNAIAFYLGIDRETNNEGIQGGDLDPVKGMYWSWQTGYINFKMEGKSSLSSGRNHGFSFHLGGYSDEFYATQEIGLPVPFTDTINLYMDLEQLISKVNFAEKNSIMIPCKESVALLRILSTIFRTE